MFVDRWFAQCIAARFEFKLMPENKHDFESLLTLIERLARRIQESKRTYLESAGYDDVSAFQASIMRLIADGASSPRKLVSQGVYLGATLTYNLKALVQDGFLSRSTVADDKRSARFELTEKASNLLASLSQWSIHLRPDAVDKEIADCTAVLENIERRLQASLYTTSAKRSVNEHSPK